MMFGNNVMKFMGVDLDEEEDETVADLVKEGKVDAETGVLLGGLFGLEEPLAMPVDPGRDFGSYMAEQDGLKGFIGAIADPRVARAFYGDDYTTYKDKKAQYLTDKSLFDVQQAGRVKRAENSAGDLQDEEASAYLEAVRAGKAEWDPMTWAALVGKAAGYSAFNPNGYTVSPGQTRLDAFGNEVASGRPKDDSTTAERNLRARNELYAREPADKTSKEWAAWDKERKFFETSIRANQVVNGTIFSGSGNGVMGDPDTYTENTENQAAAAQRGQTDVQTAATMFADAKTGAEEAYGAMEEYDFSLQNANEVLTGLQDGKYQTGMARSLMLDYLGLGGISDGELLAMGTDEAITKVQGFNGHTTDFEYGQAFNAAFARLKNNKDVNIGVMQYVIKGLENARQNAESKYTSSVYDASNAARATVETRYVARLNKRNQTKYPKAPKIGFERDGLRYMGGDPTNLLNWVETE